MIVKQAFFISAQKIITATVGASFSVSIMLILTWRCNYINYSTMRIYLANEANNYNWKASWDY